MKNIFSIMAVFASAFLLFSCGGSTGDLVGLNNVLPNYLNTKVLKKVNIQESGGTAYDVNYLFSTGKLTSVTTSNNSYSYVIEYIGTQISKITRNVQSNPMQVLTSNMVYIGSQLSKIDGNLSEGGAITKVFSTNIAYTGGKISQVKTETFLPGSTVATKTIITDIEYAANNVSKINYSEQIAGAPATNIITTYSNYDSDPNPFRTLPTSYLVSNINWNLDLEGTRGLSTNNYKTSTTQGVSENLSYTYDSGGYPTQASSPTRVLKFEYQVL